MKNNFNLYLIGMKVALSNKMAYRGDFFISLFIMLISEMFAPLITFLIYKNGAAFPGWSFEEIMLLQGVFLLSKGIAFLLFFGVVRNTLIMVREGTFDLLLIKPKSVLFMSLVNGIDVGEVGRLISGLIVFVFAVSTIASISALQWLLFVFLFLFSVIVMLAFAIIMASTVIKWVGNGRVYEIFEAMSMFGLYPKTIFSKAFANIISYVIPITIIGFFPASALLGKPVGGVLFSVVVSILFLLLSTFVWRMMMRYYTSAGG